MAKIQEKQRNCANKAKKKTFSAVLPKTSEVISLLDAMALAQYQTKVRDVLELERDEIVGQAQHDHHKQGETREYRNGY